MTNEQLIVKLKTIIKDDDINKYAVNTDFNDVLRVIKFDLNDLKCIMYQAEDLCKMSDMSEEIDLRGYMRLFEVTLVCNNGQGGEETEVLRYCSTRENVYKNGPWRFITHKEIEITA